MVIKMERVSTGIEELDEKLGGGYPEGKMILVTGIYGSGKTIFELHFIHRSCLDGKKCILLATEEMPDDILQQASFIGLDLKEYYESGQLVIERIFENRSHKVQTASYGFTPDGLAIDLPSLADHIPNDADVVVIDNIGVFTLRLENQDFRDQLDALNYVLMRKGCTSIFIMDEAAYELSNQIADYSAYGSVRLLIKENPYTGKVERYLSIPKMRSTNISPDMFVFEITSEGIKFK